MNSFVELAAGATALAIAAAACAAHWRFTQRVADAAPGLLVMAGVLGTVVGIALAGFEAAGELRALGRHVAVALVASAVGLAAALSLALRHTFFGIPRAMALDPGPSNGELMAALVGLRAMFAAEGAEAAHRAAQALAQQQRLHDELVRQGQAQGAHQQRMQAQAAHLGEAFAGFAGQQTALNREMVASLERTLEHFSARIDGQFRGHLATLEEAVARAVALQAKHCAQVTDMMHHDRRLADAMGRTTESFELLVERSTSLAEVSGHLQRASELLGPRQEALAAALAELASRSDTAAEAAQQRLEGLRSALEESIQDSGNKIRRQLADEGSKARQHTGSIDKELEALSKSAGSQAQQLSAMSSKFGADLAGVSQQLKRLLDWSRIARA